MQIIIYPSLKFFYIAYLIENKFESLKILKIVTKIKLTHLLIL